jgi:hypothetical protein
MESKHFDAITRGLTRETSRRRAVGGVLAGAMALLTSGAALEAKPGGGKGPGKTKTQICHYQGTKNGTPKYKVLKLGGPGAENHLNNHEHDAPYVDCCPGDTCPDKVCHTTAGCDATGRCAYVVTEGALCQNNTGTCDASGECILNT